MTRGVIKTDRDAESLVVGAQNHVTAGNHVGRVSTRLGVNSRLARRQLEHIVGVGGGRAEHQLFTHLAGLESETLQHGVVSHANRCITQSRAHLALQQTAGLFCGDACHGFTHTVGCRNFSVGQIDGLVTIGLERVGIGTLQSIDNGHFEQVGIVRRGRGFE